MIFFSIWMILAVFIMILGLLIWKKEKIGLIHDYNYQNVRDRKGYTTAMGKAVFSIGILFSIFDVISIIKWIPKWINFIVIVIGIIVILIIIYKIQKKYNGGIF